MKPYHRESSVPEPILFAEQVMDLYQLYRSEWNYGHVQAIEAVVRDIGEAAKKRLK